MINPSVGHGVVYVATKDDTFATVNTEVAAVVAAVNPDGSCDLRLFPANDEVPHLQGITQVRAEDAKAGCWHLVVEPAVYDWGGKSFLADGDDGQDRATVSAPAKGRRRR